jgi:protein-disulfide isomerase
VDKNKYDIITIMENTNKKISTPQAIILAGFLVMVAILLTKTGGNSTEKTAPKTLSEKVDVSKDKLTLCIQNTDTDQLSKNITDSVTKAMEGVPQNERGTPYSVIIGKNGPITDIRGSLPYSQLKIIVDDALLGKSSSKYIGNIPLPNKDDHIKGNLNADIIVVEYSDYECPYCKAIHSNLEQLVQEYDGKVAWIYRHWPLHQNSFEKLLAAECVSQIKGNDAFWEYSELLFGLLKTSQDSITDQL